MPHIQAPVVNGSKSHPERPISWFLFRGLSPLLLSLLSVTSQSRTYPNISAGDCSLLGNHRIAEHRGLPCGCQSLRCHEITPEGKTGSCYGWSEPSRICIKHFRLLPLLGLHSLKTGGKRWNNPVDGPSPLTAPGGAQAPWEELEGIPRAEWHSLGEGWFS